MISATIKSDKTKSSFETQILKQSCLILFVASIGATINNILLDLEILITLITSFLAIMNAILWLLLKRETNFILARILFTSVILIMINLGWFYNYTSIGPVLGLYLLICIAFAFIWPLKTSIYIAGFIVLNILVLFWFDLNYSNDFLKYPSDQARIMDVYLTVIAATIVGYIFSRFAKSNYLKKYDEAKKSDEMKTVFLQNMSHELRTPLNAIIGFSEIINEDLSVSQMVNYNKIINTSGNHLLSLVNDLMDITLIESGETKVVKEDIDLSIALEEIYNLMEFERQNLKKDQLSLTLKIPTHTDGVIIHSDDAKLKQLLINLIKNALKYTNEGRVIFGYNVKPEKTGSVLEFFVKDTGMGIKSESLGKIFDAFWQADHSRTRLHGGTGIGLSISKKLAILLGGELWVESEVGLGSTFFFKIPFDSCKIEHNLYISKNRTASKEAQKYKNQNKQKLILIAEDIEASYEYLKVVLEKMEINTLWAKNGEDAIKICSENAKIDLVLMDINMPIVNGYEATKEIKAIRPELPIIAQTAYAIMGDRQKSIEEGCDDYISKPIKKEALGILINKYLNI